MNLQKLKVAASSYLKEKNYWLDQLAGDWLKTFFPFDEVALPKINEGKHSLTFSVPNEYVEKLQKLTGGSAYGIHLYLLANILILLNKYLGRQDLVIGTPIYQQEGIQEFINTILPIRCQIDKEESTKGLLLKLKKVLLDANENQNYPIELLPQDLGRPNDEIGFSLLDVIVGLEELHNKDYLKRINYNFLFFFQLEGNQMNCTIEYNSQLYSASNVTEVFNRLMLVLSQSLYHLEAPVESIEKVSQEEQDLLLNSFGKGADKAYSNKSLYELFELQVNKTPNHVAIQSAADELTYSQLLDRADHYYRLLLKAEINAGHLVGILMDNSIDSVATVLGVLKSGAAFLPIHTELPEKRILYILEDSKANLVVSQAAYQSKLLNYSGRILWIDEKTKLGEAVNTPTSSNPKDLAYVIYTSGTTGKPKGVMIHQRAILNYTHFAVENYYSEGIETVALFTPLSFDLTLTSIFPPLVSGKKIKVYGNGDISQVLYDILSDHDVNLLKITPSHLNILALEERPFNDNQIKKIIVGGEQLKMDLCIEVERKLQKEVEIINEYGPTEATVGCMTYKFNPEDSGEVVPIGKPMDNFNIYLLDENYEPVPVGFDGQIYIGGAGLSTGYLNLPYLTKEKFISNLLGNTEHLFATGDIGRWLPDGNMIFKGRIDNQVKLRGYRVELDEIMNKIKSRSDVKDAKILIRKDTPDDGYLCAYLIYQSKENRFSDWEEWLQEELPSYMIPKFYIEVENWPLTLNGKLDINALPDPHLSIKITDQKPRNLTEKKLAEIWHEILGIDVDHIHINDNFFMLGGQSIRGIKMVAKIYKEFNIKINLIDVFDKKTIKDIATLIQNRKREKYKPIPAAKQKEYYDLSSAQMRFYSLQNIDPDNKAYNLTQVYELVKEPNIDKIEQVFNKLIERHSVLRTAFKEIEGKIYQRVHEKLKFTIKIIHCNELDISPSIEQFIRPFRLNELPLLRAGIIKNKDNQFFMVVDMHHILVDGISHRMLSEEFIKLYGGQQMPDPTLQYTDYSEWINYPQQESLVKESESYWLNEFSRSVKRVELPIDVERPPVQSFHGSHKSFSLDKESSLKLKEMATEERVTLNALLLSIYFLFLSKICNQDEITVGIPTGGREHPDLENVIGLFLNTIALRVVLEPQATVSHFFKEINRKNLLSMVHQYYPFNSLVKNLGLARQKNRNPLFDVAYSYNDSEMFVLGGEDSIFQTSPIQSEGQTSKFDLTLHAIVSEELIVLDFEYNTLLLNEQKIERFRIALQSLIQQVIEGRKLKIEDLHIGHDLTSVEDTGIENEINFSF